ncbi:GGDEF domain-containing protein [Pseudomonas sp. CBMAI 2609]|uniref:diguanylate cyclase n=1 Tax=Pseudomonas flavocrustae TaxID=2991719 RepID=A0ABT6IK66_9PSED|nr:MULTISPECIES: GGDEF domain-containing protein [Pseudomonas]MDH4764836.1 GGDEF domain-containing protein [Pseudomonas sp. CBMAI 2609]MDK8263031.1 GGDEF domain-containing protein [Pseudomonas oryzihabitans]
MSLSLALARALARPFWALRFEPVLERHYQRDIARSRRRHLRISLTVAILAYASFSIWDWILMTDAFWLISLLSALVVVGGGLVLLALRLMPAEHPAREWVGILPCLLAYAPPLLDVEATDAAHRALWLATMPLMTLFTNSCIAPPLRQAAVHSLVALLAIGLATQMHALPALEASLVMTLAFATASFTLLNNFWMERARRQGYLLILRDRLRNEELTASNRFLAQQSATDPLTGVANRRALMQALANALAHPPPRPLLLLMIDVDHFKAFNDRYGHPAGDRCLQQVATALADELRAGDCLARYGGEEFAILCTPSREEDAGKLAQRLLDAVRRLEIPHLGPHAGPRVTVSIGGACARPDHDCAETFIEAADRQLYWAKQAGRDRAILEDCDRCHPAIEEPL